MTAKKLDCVGPNCPRPARRTGLCDVHAAQVRKGLPLTEAPTRGLRATRDADGNKRCSACGVWRPEGAFVASDRASDGLKSQCRLCERLAKYGLDAAGYEALLAQQVGVCAGCGTTPDDLYALHVDHDHACCPDRKKSCGKCVRGLLCMPCNAALGLVKDNVATLLRLAAYLG